VERYINTAPVPHYNTDVISSEEPANKLGASVVASYSLVSSFLHLYILIYSYLSAEIISGLYGRLVAHPGRGPRMI
jgi:hypothetical protein